MESKNTTSTGNLGESIACKFLVDRGFEICDRNYRKKYGEIDVVAQKRGRLCFVEVKSVLQSIDGSRGYRPEENVHRQKLRRLSRAIETYLLEKDRLLEKWDFWVLVVFIDKEEKTVEIRCIKDVVPARN
ncbi:MAG: YraN family protein [Candidatus Pacebacteria bacterium]|nr:YraN family protein [Candidatus Paceibacterota bacterium]